jgi:hypothetical protein
MSTQYLINLESQWTLYITCVKLQTRLMPLIIRVSGTEEEEEWVCGV